MRPVLAILIGLFCINIDAFAGVGGESSGPKTNPVEVRAQDLAGQPDDGLWVEVEPSNLLPSDITGVYLLIPYRSRRDKWGQTLSLGYSSFSPVNYEPNFIAAGFTDIYSKAELPLTELQFSIKRNLVIGAIGAEFGVGIYKNTSDSDLVASDLQVIPVRLGLNFQFDNLFHEPYVVPYGFGGVYTLFYNEKSGTSALDGNTQIAPYVGGGVAIQLNWVDREAARISYLDSGIENTFIYFEGRSQFKSVAAADPNFSTGFNWGGGVRVEF